jgi:hypothetical protein
MDEVEEEYMGRRHVKLWGNYKYVYLQCEKGKGGKISHGRTGSTWKHVFVCISTYIRLLHLYFLCPQQKTAVLVQLRTARGQ